MAHHSPCGRAQESPEEEENYEESEKSNSPAASLQTKNILFLTGILAAEAAESILPQDMATHGSL